MTSLTFNSLNSGGKWGRKSGSIYKTVPFGSNEADSANAVIATVEGAARKRMEELLQGVPEDRKAPGEVVSIDSPGGQEIMRAYLDLVNAAHALNSAKYNGSALDLGLQEFVWQRSTGAATTWCFVFSAFVGILFVAVAVLISIWGFDVHGVPTNNITALAAYVDGVPLSTSANMTCSIEAQDKFELDKFLGVPDTNVFWNLYGGLVLGLIFGFLDNFGLFYGMGALDSFFYGFGSKVAAGIMSWFRRDATSASADAAVLLLDLHTVTSDLMAGLGNTFSGTRHQEPHPTASALTRVLALADLLGVALGTAALEIAKAGLNVDPMFWVLDLVAIVLGCLLGCFMPVLVKHKTLLGGGVNDNLIATIAWINIFGLFAAVFLAGVPYVTFNVVSVAIVSINIIFLIIMLTVSYCSGGGVRKSAVAHLTAANAS